MPRVCAYTTYRFAAPIFSYQTMVALQTRCLNSNHKIKSADKVN